MSEVSDMIRKMFAEGDDKRDAGLTTPEDVERFDDILYGEDEKWQVLDVYRPKSVEGKLPVIISVHGGGWVYGDKERYQFYCMSLARRGFAVVNFTYRLAPEFKFPAPIEDTNLVAEFVVNNNDKYGFDLNNIFAVGDSAGAHLLGLYTCILTNSEYKKQYEIKQVEGFKLKAIALNCGVYKVDAWNGEGSDMKLMSDLLPEGGTNEEIEKITIANYVTDKYPPVFLMTADGDFLKEQPMHMIEKLLENNVPHIFRYYKSDEEPLGHVFHLKIKTSDATLCNDEECDFFRKYMG
ncbi:MAG: alpha/beta hydrolase [Pseudobutyrivibrio sp.]|nr:alpha/beta hydrolase [Pseudobutyrivibrio sp.]